MTPRTSLALTLALCALCAGAQEDPGAQEARALFDAFEQTLTQAASLRIEFAGPNGVPPARFELSGLARFAPEERFELAVAARDADDQEVTRARVLCDGASIFLQRRVAGREGSRTVPTAPGSVKQIRLAARRLGLSGLLSLIDFSSVGDGEELELPVEGFRLLPDETYEGRPCRVIAYVAVAGETRLGITLWLDRERRVPLKRAVHEGELEVVVERYSTFELDPELTPESFQLPATAGEEK